MTDSGGYNRHGTVAGSPLPTRANATPAIAGATGTCGYGSFTGGTGEIIVTGLPVNLTMGANTSVSFWMRWDGTTNVMPIGWQQHDLWLTGGFFGFNTGNGDVYGINSTGLANSWHHVVAIFTNGSVATNSLYIDGVAQVLSQKQSAPITSAAVVNSTLRISGWGASTGYKFRGLIDQVKVYNGALTPAEVSALYTETHNCTTATLSVKKTNQLICDAVNGMSNPKHIPSAMVKWNVTISNVGSVSANLNQLADALSGNTAFDSNLVAPSNATTCNSATGAPTSAAGKGFKFSLTGTTRPATSYPKFLTSSNADSDGASHNAGNVSLQYPLVMPAESGYTAGELRPGEAALVDFNVTVQ